MRRSEAVEYRGFRVIQIWELQDDLTAGWPSVSFAHMSGLHAAGMHKIDLLVELCLEECGFGNKWAQARIAECGTRRLFVYE